MKITNEDNMLLMARYPDNYFDLAIVDPPYGINIKTRVFSDGKSWDNEIPSVDYFKELKRVSINQVIFGGNYFLDHLGATKCMITWDKMDTAINGLWRSEIAWTSFDSSSYVYRTKRPGEMGFFIVDCKRIHPTQKPVKLYEWLLYNYAKEGDKILDTHLGSGSIAIACHNRKFDLTACELDKEYYDAAMQRLKIHKQQLTMF